MKAELAASGLSEEEILHKAQMLMKAFGREDSSSMAEFSLASAQKNAALKQNGTSPKDFAQVSRIVQIKKILDLFSCINIRIIFHSPNHLNHITF